MIIGKARGINLIEAEIDRRAMAGDAACEATLQRYENRLGRALASIINILDPQIIVLGGGLSKLERLYRNLPTCCGPHVFSDVFYNKIVPPIHGDSSGVRVAALAVELMAQFMPMAQISLFIGGISALPLSGRPTAMLKQQALGPLELGTEGFIGDQQADRRVHGRAGKSGSPLPRCTLRQTRRAFPEAASQLLPGSLGENISCAELDETSVRIGDIYRLGNARLQVCQPRNPCWKIDDQVLN